MSTSVLMWLWMIKSFFLAKFLTCFWSNIQVSELNTWSAKLFHLKYSVKFFLNHCNLFLRLAKMNFGLSWLMQYANYEWYCTNWDWPLAYLNTNKFRKVIYLTEASVFNRSVWRLTPSSKGPTSWPWGVGGYGFSMKKIVCFALDDEKKSLFRVTKEK